MTNYQVDNHHQYFDEHMVILRRLEFRRHSIHHGVTHALLTRLHPSQDLGYIGEQIVIGLGYGVNVRIQYRSVGMRDWVCSSGGASLSGGPEMYRAHPDDLHKVQQARLTAHPVDPLEEMFSDEGLEAPPATRRAHRTSRGFRMSAPTASSLGDLRYEPN